MGCGLSPLVEFRDPEDELIGVCLTDRLGDGLSAVYSFFAPELVAREAGAVIGGCS